MLKKDIKLKSWDYKTWLPIILAIIAIILTLVTMKLQGQMDALERVFQPLNFSVSRGDPTAFYQISDLSGNVLSEIPAYSVRIQADTGAYREFTQIRYNGVDELELASADLNVLESGQYEIISNGQIPISDYPADTDVVYDYFFIYTVSASGERELWLVYYELDLTSQAVSGPFKESQTSLLLLGTQMSPSKSTMMQNFWDLSERVAALPL